MGAMSTRFATLTARTADESLRCFVASSIALLVCVKSALASLCFALRETNEQMQRSEALLKSYELPSEANLAKAVQTTAYPFEIEPSIELE